MNPELPPKNRAELEARVTALWLGELTAEESVALCQIIAQDPELAKFHNRLHRTLDFVRESAVMPAGEPVEPPLKLSAARREALLAQFKTVPLPEPARPPSEKIVWIAELAAAIVIVFILAGLFLPQLTGSSKRARAVAAEYAMRSGRAPASASESVQEQNGISVQMQKEPSHPESPRPDHVYSPMPESPKRPASPNSGNTPPIPRQRAVSLGVGEPLAATTAPRPAAQLYLPPANQDTDLSVSANDKTVSNDSEAVREIIPLHNLNPTQLSKDLYGRKLDGVEIETTDGGNALFVSGKPADISRFAQKIEALDQGGERDLLALRLTNTDSKAAASQINESFAHGWSNATIDAASANPLGTIFGRGRGGGGGSGGGGGARGNSGTSPYADNGQVAPVTFTTDPVTGSIIYLTDPDNAEIVQKAIESTDSVKPFGSPSDVYDNYWGATSIAKNPNASSRLAGESLDSLQVTDLGGLDNGQGYNFAAGNASQMPAAQAPTSSPASPANRGGIGGGIGGSGGGGFGGGGNFGPSSGNGLGGGIGGGGFSGSGRNQIGFANMNVDQLQGNVASTAGASETVDGGVYRVDTVGYINVTAPPTNSVLAPPAAAPPNAPGNTSLAYNTASTAVTPESLSMQFANPVASSGFASEGNGADQNGNARGSGGGGGSGGRRRAGGGGGAGGGGRGGGGGGRRGGQVAQANTDQTQAFKLNYAASADVANQLAALFPDPNAQTNQQGMTGQGRATAFVPGGLGNGGGGAASSRKRQPPTVSAIPDPATQSVIVTAPKDQMAQVAEMIAELDGNPAKRQQLYTYRPSHGDVADMYQPLKDLFASTSIGSTATNSSTPPGSALSRRITQDAQNQQTQTTLSASTGGGGGATRLREAVPAPVAEPIPPMVFAGRGPVSSPATNLGVSLSAEDVQGQSNAWALRDVPVVGNLFRRNGSTSVVLDDALTATTTNSPVGSAEFAMATSNARAATNPRNAASSQSAAQVAPVATPKADVSFQTASDTTDAPPAKHKQAVSSLVPQPEILTSTNAFSTFSLNVSDVSFKLAAASLQNGALPDRATVRSEEFINAFDYRDSEPAPGAPIGFAWERSAYPFSHNRDLLRFSVKTSAEGRQAGRPLNLVLLLDKSGSMERADRVAIIREALRTLAAQLQPQDKFTVIVFARTARLWADGVPGNQAGAVADALSGITPEGGTNLEEAMKLAYEAALRHYLPNGENRVVVLTDGAANLGEVAPDALKKKVEANRAQGVALDCFGIGWEDYNDNLLEVLSRAGGGRYGFVNTPEEAASGFAGQLAGALRVAASDVKVQVEFNPARVISYRQIGYAKDQLAKEQFRDNSVKAAQIGAAESGNALYTVEINPAGDGPLCTVHVRYRDPGTSDYHEHAWDVPYTGAAPALDQSAPAMRLAATACAFSEWLAASPYAGEVNLDQLLGYMRGVPQFYGADARPAQLEGMLREAKSLSGK